jgi:hypothetical protein
MGRAITLARLNEREYTNMKISRTRQGAYIGAGAGLVLFGLFGLLPGSLMGGAAGIRFAGMFFGLPLEPGLFSRLIVVCSMLLGGLVAGTAIVTASSALGWLAGSATSALTREHTFAGAERR